MSWQAGAYKDKVKDDMQTVGATEEDSKDVVRLKHMIGCRDP